MIDTILLDLYYFSEEYEKDLNDVPEWYYKLFNFVKTKIELYLNIAFI